MFMGMGTQWDHAGLYGSRVGLKYESLEPVARALGIALPLAQSTFHDLRVLESEALDVWSKRRHG